MLRVFPSIVFALMMTASPVFAQSEPVLTEQDIAPCNDLLSIRLRDELPCPSNLELALTIPPFEPAYSLAQTKARLTAVQEGITAIESGSVAAQRKIFGIVYTGKDAELRLTGDRRFQCLLKVRLRQLQKQAKSPPGRKK